MARMARLVVPGQPHHVTQRGVRGLKTFDNDDDYAAYLALLAESSAEAGTAVWAYCLMPTHVHLILVPADADGLRAALADAHRRYTRRINLRQGVTGHLWQERFHSFPMDEAHLAAAARYIELNPVRAELVRSPEMWRWSSAGAHLSGRDDAVVKVAPLLDRISDWRTFLAGGMPETEERLIDQHLSTGRPLGSAQWLEQVAASTGRDLRRRKPGPKAKERQETM